MADLVNLLLLIDYRPLHQGLLHSISKFIKTLRMHNLSFDFAISLKFIFSNGSTLLFDWDDSLF